MTRPWAILAITLAACLAGCASQVPLQRAQVGGLSRESTPADIDRILQGATLVAQTDIEAQGAAFLARHYALLTGTRQEMTMVCSPQCLPIFITVPVTTEYVVIQRMPSRVLHAWGTLEELSKDPDPAISGLMPVVKARFEDAKKKKP